MLAALILAFVIVRNPGNKSEISGREFRAHSVQCVQLTGKEDEVQEREEVAQHRDTYEQLD